MMILRQKVPISTKLWIIVSVIVAAFLSNGIVMQKGGETERVYDLWLSVFMPSSYRREGIGEIAGFFGMVSFITLFALGIAALVGWLISAIFGSFMVLIRRQNDSFL